MSLNKLREKFLFNNLLDIWIALCEEKGWDWFNVDAYYRFLNYLKEKKVKLNKVPVCVEEQGKKALFVKTFSKEKGLNFEVYTLKLDDKNIKIIRNFV
ncbi:hypothetical protein HRbin06_01130 [archaeon HR06]|nr:hypothetical protein HRbin06_01130 [archaeon HR06]